MQLSKREFGKGFIQKIKLKHACNAVLAFGKAVLTGFVMSILCKSTSPFLRNVDSFCKVVPFMRSGKTAISHCHAQNRVY